MTRETTADAPESSEGGTIVTTREELEDAFADLSPGDTVRISDENAPYRTTEWLDVDVDDVTVVGPGVRTLIRPMSGANVGGFRIGHNERCRGTLIRGVGFRGTPTVPRGSAERLHGIAVRNATDVTLERNEIRETYPRAHGDGGSGISVTRRCSDVRILDNRIHTFGDRGVQLAGERIVVSGNEVSGGLDRPIACDLWYPDRRSYTAESVSVFGNMLGNSVEGSLIGVARNDPTGPDHGYVSVFGNVGFGHHKSFCHVRGPNTVRNVTVRNNVSRQSTDGLDTEETTKFAGVTIDGAAGENLLVENNELYDYSGHGVNVVSTVEGIGVRNNTISSPGLAGIRLVGDVEGVVDGNHVAKPSETGIRLEGTSGVTVRGNDVRKPGGPGILTVGSRSGVGDVVTANHVVAGGADSSGGSSSGDAPAIVVRDYGARVRGNAVRQGGGAAIVEGDDAGDNFYEGNWADGRRPWRIANPTSRIRNHAPPVDVHRNVTTDADRPVVRLEFDQPYARPPRLSFGRVAGGVRERAFETDDDGNYVGVRLTARNADAPMDVFVDPA
ncbi:right-handed parallel beta-helix repeat-containing protein [Halorarum salinum]|uniref:Right-handed parallel beta-helix repeat-containing protein n=1 Tax=Halorarum salinum TaxID=2743089 RepID=A0A7D5QC04_9EURY|nr:right-handed parallel beta-helix repeat-containing protein [Halobaculum salinum]QLG62679.1 right-handed parallel beta-helix repeat-containing protein [Halobaculum salinum]